MSQEEFTAIRGELAEVRSEMKQGFAAVASRFDTVDGHFDALTTVLADIRDDVKDLKRDNAELIDLRLRVVRLEKKLGLE